MPQVARHFDAAIEAGNDSPCLVVFVNGLVEGMYVDGKGGLAPAYPRKDRDGVLRKVGILGDLLRCC